MGTWIFKRLNQAGLFATRCDFVELKMTARNFASLIAVISTILNKNLGTSAWLQKLLMEKYGLLLKWRPVYDHAVLLYDSFVR